MRSGVFASFAGLAVVALLAIAALLQWHVAHTQSQLAETRLTAAVSTANSLVSDFAYKFRHTVGVPIGLVEEILERVNKFQEELGADSPQLQQSKADARFAAKISNKGTFTLFRFYTQTRAQGTISPPLTIPGARGCAKPPSVSFSRNSICCPI